LIRHFRAGIAAREVQAELQPVQRLSKPQIVAGALQIVPGAQRSAWPGARCRRFDGKI
jgi:hypothetical protein